MVIDTASRGTLMGLELCGQDGLKLKVQGSATFVGVLLGCSQIAKG